MRLYRSFLTSLLVVPLSFIVPRPVTAQVSNVAAGDINVFAGNYYYRSSANPIDTGVAAKTVALQVPDGLAMDAAGNLYIADKNDNVVRKVDPAGVITTVAGNGTPGSLGDGGAATSAQLKQPIAVAVDGSGNLYIADYGNYVVRKVDSATGLISTFAGNGVAPAPTGTPADPIGDGGPAIAASLDPESLAVNSAGDLYIADKSHYLVRKVDHVSGNISTVAGTLYTRGYLSTSEGGPGTGAYLDSPKALAVDANGNLYIADQYGERIFKVNTSGNISTFAGTGAPATDPTASNGDGGTPTSAQLSDPAGLATDAAGNVFIMDQSSFRVRKVDVVANKITTVAGSGVASPSGGIGLPAPGDGSLAINAQLNQYAAGLAVSSSGYLYIADFGNSVVRVVNLAAASTAAVTLDSDVANTSLTVTGNVSACAPGPYTTPTTLTWTARAKCSVTVGVPAGYTYGGWIDAPAATNPRTFDAPATATTYTAHFSATPPACTYALSAVSTGVPATGGDGSLNVTSQTGCGWTATSNNSWVTVTAGTPGTSNGTVSFHADANSGTSTRTGTLTVAGQSFTITQAAAVVTVPAGLRFVPVTPCRVADTREAAGPFGAPVLGGQTTRDFAIPQSACGIPADAQAYSLNFTVVPSNGNALQYITVFPTGQPKPLASTLNSFDGRTKANAAIVPAGTNGSVSVFSTDSTELIIDVNGYFVPASNTSALAFYPMTPCRIVDTRADTNFATGSFGAPALSAGEERNIPVQTSSCQIPATAQAYSLNYTVVPKKNRLGYLTTWPTGQGRPVVSTLNATTGAITANAAIVPAGSNGDLSVYATEDTELLIDINGYFAPPATGGLSFYNLAPCRVLDTREVGDKKPMVDTMGVTVAGTCNAPANAQSYVFNTTVVPMQSLLYMTLWPHGVAEQPTVSALNALDGVVTSNLAIVPSSDGSVNAFAHDSTHLILDIFGYFAP